MQTFKSIRENKGSLITTDKARKLQTKHLVNIENELIGYFQNSQLKSIYTWITLIRMTK